MESKLTAMEGADIAVQHTSTVRAAEPPTLRIATLQGIDCPVCRVPLQVMRREEVEIDLCPRCRGIWLDRGELDKIIARTFTAYVDTFEDAPRSHNDVRRKKRHRVNLNDLLREP